MPVPTDPYNFVNGTTADADQVDARFLPLYTALAGALDETNLAAAVKVLLGLSDAGSVRRGKSVIATEETRASSTYDFLTTPDRVQNIVLPTDGLIMVGYRAAWKNSVGSAGRAALYLGANAVKVIASATVAGEAVGPVGSSYGLLYSKSAEEPLVDLDGYLGAPYGGPATNGVTFQIVAIEAAAGTYDVGVKFKATSGTVSAKNRKLLAWTVGF